MVEAVEDMRKRLRRNSLAGIFDHEGIRRETDGDATACCIELDGIPHEIPEELPQQRGIALDRHGSKRRFDLHLFLLSEGAMLLQNVFRKRAEIDGFHLKDELVEAGKFQKPIDQCGDFAQLFLCCVQMFPVIGSEKREIDGSMDGGKRRPELMARILGKLLEPLHHLRCGMQASAGKEQSHAEREPRNASADHEEEKHTK